MATHITKSHLAWIGLVHAAVVPSLFGAGNEQTLTLVHEGKSAATIVVAENATRPAQLAAFELQHHIQLITRAQVPIVSDKATVPGTRILVGESGATKALGLTNESFEHQEYLIRFLPDTIVLMGRDEDKRDRVDYDYRTDPNAVRTWPDVFAEQGTMYATHDFLEHFCGGRWINPTEAGTILRRTKMLTVKGTELRRRPFMPFRGGMDNSAFCRCETCTPQYEMDKEPPSQHSTYWFRFVEAVAREIRKSHPDKFLSTLAYMTHEELPTNLRIPDNVAVHFCISANRNCASSATHLKQQFSRLQEWKDKQPQVPLYLWHYHCFPKEIADNGKFHCFPGFFAHG